MLSYANQSHSIYQQHLQRNRQKLSANEQKAKERKRAAEAINVLEAMRVKLKRRNKKRTE